jgi:hypothetical protein
MYWRGTELLRLKDRGRSLGPQNPTRVQEFASRQKSLSQGFMMDQRPVLSQRLREARLNASW